MVASSTSTANRPPLAKICPRHNGRHATPQVWTTIDDSHTFLKQHRVNSSVAHPHAHTHSALTPINATSVREHVRGQGGCVTPCGCSPRAS